jgi:phosphate/sulfate permease
MSPYVHTQATIIAAIFEFGGAMILGRVSTQTIAGGIASVKSFEVKGGGSIAAGVWQ